MKNKLLLILIVFIIQLCTAFSEGNIVVLDSLSKKPLQNAHVNFTSLENKSKKSLKKTDNTGKVTNPFSGKTQVYITFVGYHNIVDTISSTDKTYYLSSKDIEMDEVVVTGNFKPMTAQKSVYNVKSISQEKIDNNSASSLRELLITESNIRISQDNIWGSNISINGVNGENIKIMVDGIPLIGRLNGSIDVSQINLNNIKRVEIIEGPMSSIYGSDALGGVINLISKDPNNQKTEINLNSYYESVGSYKFNASTNFSYAGLNFLLNGGRDLFQGYDRADTSRDIKWNPKEQYVGTLQTSYVQENYTIRYQCDFLREYVLNRGALRFPYNEEAFDDKFYNNRLTNSIMYKGKINKNMYMDVTTALSYYNRVKNTYYRYMVDLTEKLSGDPADQDTANFNNFMFRPVFSHDKVFSNLNYQFGLDINIDNVSGKKIKDLSQNINDYAGFLSLQYEPISTMIIQPSVRLIKNSKYQAPVIPAFNFKYDFNKNFTMRASYAKGFRSPSIKELYLFFVDVNHKIYGNENLKAEKSDSYNASLIFKMSDKSYFFSIEPNIFYNSIFDRIYLVVIAYDKDLNPIYSNVNIGNYETIGSNLSLKYVRDNTTTSVSASYIGQLNSIAKETNTPKYNYSKEISVNFDYNATFIETKFNIYYKYTGKMPSFTIDTTGAVKENYIYDYHMLDFNISKKLFDIFDLTFGVKNAINVKDILTSDVDLKGLPITMPIGWGRSFFINLKIKVL